MVTKRSIGRWGEDQAARYLEEKGYTILERNLRTPYGEIDLVACLDLPEGRMIVFVEVKTRRTNTFGLPEVSINMRKQAHLTSSAEYYIQQYEDPTIAWRVDVIAIEHSGYRHGPQITHFENVIS